MKNMSQHVYNCLGEAQRLASIIRDITFITAGCISDAFPCVTGDNSKLERVATMNLCLEHFNGLLEKELDSAFEEPAAEQPQPDTTEREGVQP